MPPMPEPMPNPMPVPVPSTNANFQTKIWQSVAIASLVMNGFFFLALIIFGILWKTKKIEINFTLFNVQNLNLSCLGRQSVENNINNITNDAFSADLIDLDDEGENEINA